MSGPRYSKKKRVRYETCGPKSLKTTVMVSELGFPVVYSLRLFLYWRTTGFSLDPGWRGRVRRCLEG